MLAEREPKVKEFIKINARDTVAVALADLPAGTRIELDADPVTLTEPVPKGHKFALQPVAAGQNVIKYGLPIGHATADILPGQHVHVHNVSTNLSDLHTYTYHPNIEPYATDLPARTVNVYPRVNGDVGIRNELWIVPTVGCVNGIGDLIAAEFEREIGPLEIDGVNVFKHNYGCSQLGDDHLSTRTILQNVVRHPNAGGVLVLGLGCENNQPDEFRATLGPFDPDRVKFLVTQQVNDEIEAGVQALKEIYNVMRHDRRQPAGLDSLKIGLECGGSDGMSG
ncbi:MAG: altronate dehydratase, partial [Chloroflexi bacterium]